MSDIILFKTENSKELNCIKEELMADLEKDVQDKVLKLAWKDKYSFLLIKNYLGTKDRYYVRFNKIIFEDEDDDGDVDVVVEEKKNDKTNLKKMIK